MPLVSDKDKPGVGPNAVDDDVAKPTKPHFMLMTDRISHKFVAIPEGAVLWINDGVKAVPLVLHKVSLSAIQFRMYGSEGQAVYTYKLAGKQKPRSAIIKERK